MNNFIQKYIDEYIKFLDKNKIFLNKKNFKMQSKEITYNVNNENYIIRLKAESEYLYITIQRNNFSAYQNTFSIDDFKKYKKFKQITSIENVLNIIDNLCQNKKIKIEENLIQKHLDVIIMNENDEIIKFNLQKNKLEIDELTDYINKLNQKIDDMKLNGKIRESKKGTNSIFCVFLILLLFVIIMISYMQINKFIESIVIIIDEKIDYLEKQNSKEMNKRIDNLEERIKKDINQIIHELYMVELTINNISNINTIKEHTNCVDSMNIFPSGNIISVSDDKSIIIYDNNFNILQRIENAHDDDIQYVDIKDENNFVTCSYDKSIKTWIKKENIFIININIKEAHSGAINKVIYNSKGNLISCSSDNSIKIWEKRNNTYLNIKILYHSSFIQSILLLEDKNILISSGADGTKFWDINNNYKQIMYFEDIYTGWNNALERIDDDRIIVHDSTINLKIISISKKQIIEIIKFDFQPWGFKSIKDKGIILVGGSSNTINIYRNDNYKLIKIIQNAHYNDILGFIELKNNLFASYSKDNTIKIWSL